MIKHVILREARTLAKSKAYIISTAILVVLILVAGVVGRFVIASHSESGGESESGSNGYTLVLGVEEQMSEFQPFVEAAAGGLAVEVVPEQGGADFIQQAAESDEDVAVLAGTPDRPRVAVPGSITDGVDPNIEAIFESAILAHHFDAVGQPLNDADLAAISASQQLPIQWVSTGSESLIFTNPVGYITSMVGMMFLVFAIIFGMNAIASGVLEEKSSRVVEILLTTIRPRTLLLGKVLGIGTLVLMQVVAVAISVVAAANIAGVWVDLHLGSYLVWIVVWLLIGFFTYATLMGAVASTASRQEDLAAATTPITMFLLIPFYLGIFLVPNAPDSIATKILSIVPGFAPFIMPVRQAYLDVPALEVALAVVIGIAAIPAIAALAGRIYSNSILHMGKRLSILNAIRAKN